MDEAAVKKAIDSAVEQLKLAGAKFGYLHGSRAFQTARSDSDIDIAAFFGDSPPISSDILLPPRVDLLVLDRAPLELKGKIAARGTLLFEVDQVARVRWESITRKIYFDELPRIMRAHQEFARSVRRG